MLKDENFFKKLLRNIVTFNYVTLVQKIEKLLFEFEIHSRYILKNKVD